MDKDLVSSLKESITLDLPALQDTLAGNHLVLALLATKRDSGPTIVICSASSAAKIQLDVKLFFNCADHFKNAKRVNHSA